MKWKLWLKGLISAVVGGAANAVTAVAVDPVSFNFGDGLTKLGTMAGVGALFAGAMYLKKSPLPD